MQSGRVCEFRSSNQKFFGSIPALKNLEKIKENFWQILLLITIALWHTCFLVNFAKLFQNSSSFKELIRATIFIFTMEGSSVKGLSPILKWLLIFLTALLHILFFCFDIVQGTQGSDEKYVFFATAKQFNKYKNCN